jgi:hypothetical protein
MADESPTATFAAHAARGELAFQIDADGRPLWPPSVRGREWRVSSGRGTVYATTVMRRPGGEAEGLTLVTLDEGFRVMSRVVGVAPEDVRIGARVRASFGEDGVLVFEADA